MLGAQNTLSLLEKDDLMEYFNKLSKMEQYDIITSLFQLQMITPHLELRFQKFNSDLLVNEIKEGVYLGFAKYIKNMHEISEKSEDLLAQLLNYDETLYTKYYNIVNNQAESFNKLQIGYKKEDFDY